MGISNFITQILLSLYSLTGSLGLSIISFTVILRLLLLPLSWKSMHAQKSLQKLQPELNKLKNKHKNKQKLQQAQVELYKKYNVNPLAGCLPQIVQIGILIVLYRVFLNFLNQPVVNGVNIDAMFLGIDLRHPDKTYILPVLAGLSQLVYSLMLTPATETPDLVKNSSKNKKIKEANKKEEDVAEMAQSMQKQMIFMMPLMTAFFALRFPAGLALYWVTSTLATFIQQLAISGPGGLQKYFERSLLFINQKIKK